jgi:FkbM family methyltransferase
MLLTDKFKEIIRHKVPPVCYAPFLSWRRNRRPWRLTCLRLRSLWMPRHRPGKIQLNGLQINYTDILSLYMEYKDIFVHRIYHFEAKNTKPYIVDGGGCIGMSVLYFKSVYPDARIISFEPDGEIFNNLQTNVMANGFKNVELIQAGLAAEAGEVSFVSDGSDGGKICGGRESNTTIRTVTLSDYLDSPVDFLKLNIEGQELPVLEEAAASGRLRNVRELVLEYHGWEGGEQRLGPILMLLDREGFRYLIHDFDAETCGASKPPFCTKSATWFCLVYARRKDV